MKSSRLLLLALGCSLLAIHPLPAQTAPPYDFSKQQGSGEQIITTKEGMTINTKVYLDNGKVRSEVNTQGMNMVSIVRPDLKKVYSVMPAQKMVMEMPISEQQMHAINPASGDSKYETVGPDTIEGTACTKYKVTTPEGKVMFLWLDTTKKLPVKMAAEDGSFTMVWKNFVAGPQPASLFEPPADYQKMAMPGAPAAPPAGGQ